MTFQIRKADLACREEDFADMVRAHVERLNEYAHHLLGVEADKNNPDLAPDERRVAFPAPEAHPLVMNACRQHANGDIIADYEILGPTLAERKATLSADVRQRESMLLGNVMPSAKVRHWQFREQDIRAADHMRVSNHVTRIEPDQIDAFLRAARPSDDTAFLEEMKARHEQVAAIQRWAARCEHDIDDLTDETVDGFKVLAFNG